MNLAVPARAIVVSVLIHALWGGNTVGAKFGFLAFDPMWSGFIRFATGVVVVICFALYRKVQIWPTMSEWPMIVVVGLLFTLQIATMNIGIDLTTASMSSVLISTNPLFAALFAHYLIPGDRITTLRAIGLALAFAGVALVILTADSADLQSSGHAGNLICIGSACILGFRLVVSARALRQINELRLAIWQMLLSLPVFAVAGFATETIRWHAIDWRVIAGLGYQGVVVAGLGFATTFWLMKNFKPSIVMSFNFIAPVVGVILGAWLLGDTITPWLLAGVAAVASGLILIARRDRPATQDDV